MRGTCHQANGDQPAAQPLRGASPVAITPHRGRPAEHVSFQYRAMRGIVEQVRGRVPGKLEITEEGLVHDLASPGGDRTS